MLAGSKAGTGGPEGEEGISVQKRGGQADGSDQSQLLVYGRGMGSQV